MLSFVHIYKDVKILFLQLLHSLIFIKHLQLADLTVGSGVCNKECITYFRYSLNLLIRITGGIQETQLSTSSQTCRLESAVMGPRRQGQAL